MKILNEIEAALAAASAVIPEWQEDAGKATHEFMREQSLPCTLWETSHIWHGERLGRVAVSPIKVIKYDILPGATNPTVEFRDSDGRRAGGIVDLFYVSEVAAQAEADHAMATTAKEEANAHLIALLHNHAPALIEAVRALRDCEARLALLVDSGRSKLLDAVAAENARKALEKLK